MADIIRTVPYKTGFNVKPLSITNFGTVTFTAGDNDDGNPIPVAPNQVQCEAYGYTYNELLGTCTVNTNVQTTFNNISNKTYGPQNIIGLGTDNTLTMGENNNVIGSSRNNIITGSNNQIDFRVNNVIVGGNLAEATTSGSRVYGGNTAGDNLGERQAIQLQYGRQTTDNSTQSSYVNNEVGEFFKVPNNSIIYFHADTLVVRVGGINRSGAVGDYASYVERGVVINKSGTLSIQRERDTIKTSGTITNWRILASTSADGDFLLTVRGNTGMTLEWNCNVNITQIKTGVTL